MCYEGIGYGQAFLTAYWARTRFDDYPEMKAAVNDENLEATEEHVMILRNAVYRGPGMPEWGMLPIPKKLVRQNYS